MNHAVKLVVGSQRESFQGRANCTARNQSTRCRLLLRILSGIEIADVLGGRERRGLGSKTFAITRLEGIGIQHRLELEAGVAPRWRRVHYFRDHFRRAAEREKGPLESED